MQLTNTAFKVSISQMQPGGTKMPQLTDAQLAELLHTIAQELKKIAVNSDRIAAILSKDGPPKRGVD
jgi:hypothetical protein